GVFAHRLQHAKPWVTIGPPPCVPLEQVVLDERCNPVDDTDTQPRRTTAHGLGRLEREPADEYPEPAKERPLLGLEQAVAPADGTAQCLMPLRNIARTAGQQLQPTLESRKHRRGR